VLRAVPPERRRFVLTREIGLADLVLLVFLFAGSPVTHDLHLQSRIGRIRERKARHRTFAGGRHRARHPSFSLRQQVDLPQEMQRAIAAQAEAERERRASIIAAEGDFQASERLSQAAAVLNREPISISRR
jgi:hypothetical protein